MTTPRVNDMDFLTAHSGEITSVFFFTLFTGIACWAYLPRNKEKLQELAKIPLEGDGNGGIR